jgi:hypothetical protein
MLVQTLLVLLLMLLPQMLRLAMLPSRLLLVLKQRQARVPPLDRPNLLLMLMQLLLMRRIAPVLLLLGLPNLPTQLLPMVPALVLHLLLSNLPMQMRKRRLLTMEKALDLCRLLPAPVLLLDLPRTQLALVLTLGPAPGLHLCLSNLQTMRRMPMRRLPTMAQALVLRWDLPSL